MRPYVLILALLHSLVFYVALRRAVLGSRRESVSTWMRAHHDPFLLKLSLHGCLLRPCRCTRAATMTMQCECGRLVCMCMCRLCLHVAAGQDKEHNKASMRAQGPSAGGGFLGRSEQRAWLAPGRPCRMGMLGCSTHSVDWVGQLIALGR